MRKDPVNAHNYAPLYEILKIDLNELGCVMLDVKVPDGLLALEKGIDGLYSSKDKFWIKGFVAAKRAHLTLLYGLLRPAHGEYRSLVDYVLSDWTMKAVECESVGFFDSPFSQDPYWCIVAKIKDDPKLVEGFNRLSLLPHVNTTGVYKPHVTVCYLNKSKGEKYRDEVIARIAKEVVGKSMPVKAINYGSAS